MMTESGQRLPRVLGVIPARGGSKRLPRKNIRLLGGKPLIGYTIEACKQSAALTDWLVSTDDAEIADVSESLGAAVPFLRPDLLGGDSVRNGDVMLHALNWMEAAKDYSYDFVLLLQPTCPIRRVGDIDMAVELLTSNQGCSVVSVKGPYRKRDWTIKQLTAGGTLQNYPELNEGSKPEPGVPFFMYNASIYGVSSEHLKSTGTFTSDNEIPLYMNSACSLDIDTLEDFLLVQAVLSSGTAELFEYDS